VLEVDIWLNSEYKRSNMEFVAKKQYSAQWIENYLKKSLMPHKSIN
jgi:hypothetical protein